MTGKAAKGRGAAFNPKNRFETHALFFSLSPERHSSNQPLLAGCRNSHFVTLSVVERCYEMQKQASTLRQCSVQASLGLTVLLYMCLFFNGLPEPSGIEFARGMR
jgi:hypothetical protein